MAFRERKQPQDQQRHRHRAAPAPAPADDEDAPDRELDSYLAALSPESDVGPSELTGRFGSAEVFQLRLPALRIEQLRRFAAERGVAPASLALDWVIERLDAEDPVTGPVPVLPPPPAAGPELLPPPAAARRPLPPVDPGRHRR